MNNIYEQIPEQLQGERFRLCLIKNKEKEPFETGWNKYENTYSYNDERFVTDRCYRTNP